MAAARKRTSPLKKRLLKSAPVIWIVSLLLTAMVRLVYLTCRTEKHFHDKAAEIFAGSTPALYCFWHGRLIMHPFIRPKKRKLFALISRHADGILISAIARRLGVYTVHGSRTRGVHGAIAGLIAAAAQGHNIAITPDGPRGPLQKAANGAAYVAAQSGYPVICSAYSASRHWRFSSWDRFMFPKPFSTLIFSAAAPIYVTPEADIATTTQQIENALNRVTAAADKRAGVMA
jgi:hypothetical protein